MNIKQGIEKAIEGGYPFGLKGAEILEIDIDEVADNGRFFIKFWDRETDMFNYNFFQIVTTPTFWKTLGKTEDWENAQYGSYGSEAEFRHHDFLINLWSGNSLEEAFNLATS